MAPCSSHVCSTHMAECFRWRFCIGRARGREESSSFQHPGREHLRCAKEVRHLLPLLSLLSDVGHFLPVFQGNNMGRQPVAQRMLQGWDKES